MAQVILGVVADVNNPDMRVLAVEEGFQFIGLDQDFRVGIAAVGHRGRGTLAENQD
jgi:hypothetical protein